MDIVIVLVLVSLSLVIMALLFFASRLQEGDFDHGDRLSLLPLQNDQPDSANSSGAEATRGAEHEPESATATCNDRLEAGGSPRPGEPT